MGIARSALGAASELKFFKVCILKGIDVYTPVIPTQKDFDCLIEMDGSYKRVQVKTFSLREDARRGTQTLSATLRGHAHQAYAVDAFDYYALVSHELCKVWLVPKPDVPQSVTFSKALSQISTLDKYLF